MFPIEFLQRGARLRPDAPAVSDGHQTLDHGSLEASVNALAAGLQDVAGTDRPRVALCGYNTMEQFLAYLAIHAAGGIMVPLNPRNSTADIERQIELTRPDVAVVDEDCTDHLTGIAGLAMVAGAGGGTEHSVNALIATHQGEAPRWPDVSREDLSGIKFTGGSSGAPKGVMQTFRVNSAVATALLLTYEFSRDDKFLCAAPITHAAGVFILPTLYRGGQVMLLPKANGAAMLDAFENGGATNCWLPPTVAYAVMDAANGRMPDLSHLNTVIYGGAPMPEEKLRQFRKFFCGRVGVDYGQTEASTIVTGMGPDEMADDRNLTSVGRVAPLSSVGIVDPSGRHLPAGEKGEIVIAGELVMKGYYEMPEATAKTIRNGWLHTGDVGYLDERGYLYIKDRLRDVIISGGFNVYPSDVENGLCEHPAIYECVVFGLPDDKWGERVEAAIQLNPGQDASPEEIIAHAKARLGSVKAPKAVHILKDLPRSPVGKVQRREVRETFLSAREQA